MRKLLVVVDMQKDFVDGALGTKEAVAIVPAVVEKIRKYDIKDVFVTRDTHQENYMDTQEGKNLPVVHCIENTEGWELDKTVAAEVEGATFINKPTFGSVELAKAIKDIYEKEEIEVELIGLCTDICVISNALLLKAFYPEQKIAIDASCCAGVTPESHKNALNAMKMCQCEIRNFED